MKSNILFSIICPTFNNSSFITRCINSVLSQKYVNWELIIVDDGSTDDTKSICNSFSEKYQKIKYFYKANEGPSIARNYGLCRSKGEYILFLDGDDELTNDCLEVLAEEISMTSPECIIFKLMEIRENNKTVLWPEKNKKRETIEGSLNIINYCFFNNVYLSVCEKCFSRNILQNIFADIDDSLKRYKTNEDFLHSYLALQKCKTLSIIPDVLYLYYKTNPNSTTNKPTTENDARGKWEINQYVYDDAWAKYKLSFDNTVSSNYLCTRLIEYILEYIIPHGKRKTELLISLRMSDIVIRLIDSKPVAYGIGLMIYSLFVRKHFSTLILVGKIRNFLRH